MFYRIDDLNEIDGPLFFRLATRVGAYDGVMSVRIANQQEGGTAQQPGPQQQQPAKGTYSHAELGVAYPGVFSFGKAEKNGK